MDLKVEQLHSRANSLADEFEQAGGVEDHDLIDEAILLDREALERCPSSHPIRSVSLTRLAIHLQDRYNQFGEMEDVEEAIVLNREALMLRPSSHPDRPQSLNNLSVSLAARYSHFGLMDNLNEAIALDKEVLTLCLPEDSDRPMYLTNLAVRLGTRFDQLGAIEDLNEALSLGREAVALCPMEYPFRSNPLSNLAIHLATRYEQLGEMDELNEAIILDQMALALRPPGNPDRLISLNNLAMHLAIRYHQLGEIDDLSRAIDLDKEALTLCPQGHPGRSLSLNKLAIHSFARYNQFGDIHDLNMAIDFDREALELCPPGHLDRSISLNNLAIHLATRFNRLGTMTDLNEAIIRARDAVKFCSQSHPDRSTALNSLAINLFIRYSQLSAPEDLDEDIALHRDALALRPPGNPDHAESFNNLAICLATRYDRVGEIGDLHEAISLDREALRLRQLGHPNRSETLNYLAAHLATRYKRLGAKDDLDEAIVFNRDALALRPLGHPDRAESLTNFAANISARYGQLGETEDLTRAISLCHEALALRLLGDPYRSFSLENLASYLCTRFTLSNRLRDKEEAFILYSQLADSPHMVSSADLSAARAWVNAAEEFQHPTLPLAYETSLRFLIYHLASLPSLPQHIDIFRIRTSSLAVHAFSACIRNCSPAKAVELLEQGRGVFWNQLGRLTSPVDGVIASGPAGKALADKFLHQTSLIRNALRSPGPDQHDRICRLSVELQNLVFDIRRLPGLSRFLLPLPFSDLQQAASGGPIIVVNASKNGCDVLIILFNRDPIHIPLQITRDSVRDMSLQLYALTKKTKFMDVGKYIVLVMRQLWEEVVSPVVDILREIQPLRSRIWWCPTAEFSPLPLHAAGCYKHGQPKLSDFYISSYTPTLSALIRARPYKYTNHAAQGKCFLAIGQDKAIGECALPSVGVELTDIGLRLGALASFTSVEGPDASVSRVTNELNKNQWVHFACHGIPNRNQPFDSAFALFDGRFNVQQIIRCELERAEFVYLSACHTMVGDEKCPDEVIHLASAMQFAGFPSVIGTMWAVDDEQANKVASMFYDNMIDKSGHLLDHTRAAFALHKTMRELVDITFDQRILYVHLGV